MENETEEQLIREQPTSVFRRITAAGFIFVILMGNFWLVYLIFNMDAPPLVADVFILGMITVAIGGAGMLVQFLKRWWDRLGSNG